MPTLVGALDYNANFEKGFPRESTGRIWSWREDGAINYRMRILYSDDFGNTWTFTNKYIGVANNEFARGYLFIDSNDDLHVLTEYCNDSDSKTYLVYNKRIKSTGLWDAEQVVWSSAVGTSFSRINFDACMVDDVIHMALFDLAAGGIYKIYHCSIEDSIISSVDCLTPDYVAPGAYPSGTEGQSGHDPQIFYSDGNFYIIWFLAKKTFTDSDKFTIVRSFVYSVLSANIGLGTEIKSETVENCTSWSGFQIEEHWPYCAIVSPVSDSLGNIYFAMNWQARVDYPNNTGYLNYRVENWILTETDSDLWFGALEVFTNNDIAWLCSTNVNPSTDTIGILRKTSGVWGNIVDTAVLITVRAGSMNLGLGTSAKSANLEDFFFHQPYDQKFYKYDYVPGSRYGTDCGQVGQVLGLTSDGSDVLSSPVIQPNAIDCGQVGQVFGSNDAGSPLLDVPN